MAGTHEAPILTRGGKTATVVVLVVFLQLLVIAVLGLGAITKDRREGARDAQLRADVEAELTADAHAQRIQSEVQELLGEAVALDSPERLRFFAQRPHGGVVDALYQVDRKDGTVLWFPGTQQLWLPPTAIEAREQDAASQEERIVQLAAQLDTLRASGMHSAFVEALSTLLHTDSLRLAHNVVLPDPVSVWWARELVRAAQAGASSQGAAAIGPVAFRRALLQALEVEAINRGRREYAPEGMQVHLAELLATVDDAIACEPNAEDLAFMIASFRHARNQLDGLRPAMLAAVERFRSGPAAGAADPAAAPPRAPPRLLAEGGELFALAESALHPDRVVVLRLAPEDLRRLAEDSLATEAEGLTRKGLRLAAVRVSEPVEGKPLRTLDLARPGALELPLRLALFRERPVPPPAGGPTETFYLVIIGLAAGGLAVGAVVLVRMWRREVRLARLKADFVSNLSHELKTPLTSISLFTEMLQEGKLATDEERAEGLAILAQESQRLQRIVARMIDVARREARGTPYELSPADLNGPIRDAAQRFRRIVTQPGLELVVDLAPEPLPVLLDAAAVDDAVTNLLSNAWKYKRGDRARIEVRTRRRGRRAEIVVSDDGIGIPRHERKRVFEMFYRAENYLTRDVAGTGLGLALVRTIVRAHRGRIRLESGAGGVGTTFRLRFPLTRRALAAPAPVPASPGPAVAPLP